MAARKPARLLGKAAAAFLSAAVMGVLMGGFYSRPAARLTKGRDPWLTLTLAAALAVTVFGLGRLLGVRPLFLVSIWILSGGFLAAARVALGPFGRDRGKFGLVHAIALLLTFLAAGMSRHGAGGGGTRDLGGTWTLKN